jgi:hypothetical protein
MACPSHRTEQPCFPDWHSRDVLHAVGNYLKEQVEELDRSPDYAISELGKAIEADKTLHPGGSRPSSRLLSTP